MSLFQESLVAWLLAQAELSALIGTRLEPDVLPQGHPMPAVVYQSIDTTGTLALNRVSKLKFQRIQFRSWGVTRASAAGVAAMLWTKLQGFKGTMISHKVQKAECVDATDEVEPSPDLEGQRRYAVRQDFSFWYLEET